MIVDDEIDILEKAKLYLENNEINVVTAKDSRQALELLEKEEEIFDLILIDTQMPCSNKTAFFSMKPNSKLSSGKIDNFLQKPFTRQQLIDFVNENARKTSF